MGLIYIFNFMTCQIKIHISKPKKFLVHKSSYFKPRLYKELTLNWKKIKIMLGFCGYEK